MWGEEKCEQDWEKWRERKLSSGCIVLEKNKYKGKKLVCSPQIMMYFNQQNELRG